MVKVSSINYNKHVSSQIESSNIISDRNIWYLRLIVNKVDNNLNASKNVAKCKIRKRYVFWSITKILNTYGTHNIYLTIFVDCGFVPFYFQVYQDNRKGF